MSVVVVPFPSHPLHPSHNSSLQSTKGLALLNEIRRGNGDCGGQADVRQALKILITMRRLQQMRGGNGGSINLRSRGEVLAGIFDGIGFFFWFFFQTSPKESIQSRNHLSKLAAKKSKMKWKRKCAATSRLAGIINYRNDWGRNLIWTFQV